MGYSRNPEVLEQHEASIGFERVKQLQSCAWTTPFGAAWKVAYRIREAFYIAKLFPERYPELAKAAGFFYITTPSPDRVEAKPRQSGPVEATVLADAPRHEPDAMPSEPIHGLASASRSVPTVNLQRAEQLIDAWMKHLPSQDAITFQQTTLPESELRVLYSWARARTPKLMLLVGPGTIVLSLAEAGIDNHSWHPPTAPTPREEFEI